MKNSTKSKLLKTPLILTVLLGTIVSLFGTLAGIEGFSWIGVFWNVLILTLYFIGTRKKYQEKEEDIY